MEAACEVPGTPTWFLKLPLVRVLSLAEAPVHLSGGREVTAAVAQRCHADEAAGGEAALLVPQAPSVIMAGAGTRRELRLRRGLGADAGVGIFLPQCSAWLCPEEQPQEEAKPQAHGAAGILHTHC